MFDLLGTDITDEDMAAFANMPQLSQLEMDGCLISDEGLYHLREHKSLGALRC
jgi:hypothetical protein